MRTLDLEPDEYCRARRRSADKPHEPFWGPGAPEAIGLVADGGATASVHALTAMIARAVAGRSFIWRRRPPSLSPSSAPAIAAFRLLAIIQAEALQISPRQEGSFPMRASHDDTAVILGYGLFLAAGFFGTVAAACLLLLTNG
jgi:hypothetical protein